MEESKSASDRLEGYHSAQDAEISEYGLKYEWVLSNLDGAVGFLNGLKHRRDVEVVSTEIKIKVQKVLPEWATNQAGSA